MSGDSGTTGDWQFGRLHRPIYFLLDDGGEPGDASLHGDVSRGYVMSFVDKIEEELVKRG